MRDRVGGDSSIGAAGRDDDSAVAENELGAVVTDAKTLLESKRTAEPLACLGDVVVAQHRDDSGPGYGAVGDHNDIVTGGSHERATTYAQKIRTRSVRPASLQRALLRGPARPLRRSLRHLRPRL